MKLILCPVDFSKNALIAADFAAALAVRIEAHLIIQHAYDVPAMFTDAPMTVVRDATKQLHELSQKKLLRLVNKLKRNHPGLRAEAVSSEGVSYHQIVSFADEKGVDLIIVGATGTSKWRRMLVGSTTAKVIRDAHCAVLTVPMNVKFKGFKKIAYSTDLKEDNIRAASMIIPFAKLFDAEISFVFVDDKHLLHDDLAINKMTKRIRSSVKYAKISGYIAKDTVVSKGLEKFIKKMKIDLLVLFTHERHFPESMFHPSVTRLMSHRVELPLLSLKYTDRPLD